MKEKKPFLLILVSIFLLISVGLLSTALYFYFSKSSGNITLGKARSSPPSILLNSTRDSLEKIYSDAVKDLDTSFTLIPASFVDTLQPDQSLNSTYNKTTNTAAAFEKLRTEINTILQDQSPTADLESAKMKIGELQDLVGILKNKNTEIIKENERLYALLRQLTNEEKVNDNAAKNTIAENHVFVKNTKETSLKVDNIQLSAIATSNFIEKETSNAEETDKLVGSFSVKKNNNNLNTTSEVMIVVLQPDGKVLQNSNWETGIFYTKGGKKIYSNKLRFDNSGETRKLNFSLQAEKYLPGKYTVEVYHNGLVIARTTKTLS